MRIRDVLQHKGSDVVAISPDATIADLVRLLAEHNIGAVVVRDDHDGGGPVLGICSERDVVRQLVDGPDALGATVSTIMTRSVTTCGPEATLDELMHLMTEHRIRHVPVLDDGALAGIVSIGDIVKVRIGELEFEREQLSTYITT